jgi:hypothetical protein
LVLLLSAIPAGFAGAAERTEAEPTLATAALVPGLALTGPHHRVVARTPVRDFMGRYRIATAVGEVDALGADEVRERVREAPALYALAQIERSDAFADALEASAKRSADSVRRVVSQPVETVSSLPAGIGRALVASGRRVRKIALDVADAVARESDGAGASQAAAPRQQADQPPLTGTQIIRDYSRELAGVNRARRQIAESLGIDPYPQSPLIAKRLDAVAWATAAGGASLDLALSSLPSGLKDTLDAVRDVDSLAWDLAPADIRQQLEKRLTARGHGGRVAREWLRNGAFTPSTQLQFVRALEALDLRNGEDQALAIATRARTHHHARFLISQLRMLAATPDKKRFRRLASDGELFWAVRDDNQRVMALAVDYLSWTPTIAAVAPLGATQASPRGRVLLSGWASDAAIRALKARGWSVETGASQAWGKQLRSP